MDKECFRDRETNGDTIEHGGLGKVDQDADERKRQRNDIPFPHGQDSDLSSVRALCDKFDLVAGGGKFLHSFGGHEIDKTKVDDYSFEVGSHLLLWVGEMNGEIDIQRSQQIADTIQFLVRQHHPAADEQRTIEKADLAE